MFEGKTLIFQPRPGLGDLIWHLPIIRAIANATTTGRITLLTKPSTQADTLLQNDSAIDNIIWFDRNPRTKKSGHHDGPLGYPRLIATLSAARAETAILLHHATSLAAALRLAGIPNRHAYGYTAAQRRWLQPPFNPPEIEHAEAFEQASAFAGTLGFSELPPPSVPINLRALEAVEQRLAHLPRPWLVLGIGANHPSRQWTPENFTALAQSLLATTPISIVLLAAAHERHLASQIEGGLGAPARSQTALGWPLPEVAALLSTAEQFLGNDSGPMNLRAATGRPAHALFGVSGPLQHSPLIRAIMPEGGPRAGMEQITVQSALQSLQ